MSASRLKLLLNIWPPFRFAGIKVLRFDDDYRHAKVKLGLHWYNRNYVRTHFGGSLFSMTDPFWMIMVMHCLGRDYIVWDKAGEIDFVAPGREDVFAEFTVTEAMLEERHLLVRAEAPRDEPALVHEPPEPVPGIREIVPLARGDEAGVDPDEQHLEAGSEDVRCG